MQTLCERSTQGETSKEMRVVLNSNHYYYAISWLFDGQNIIHMLGNELSSVFTYTASVNFLQPSTNYQNIMDFIAHVST